MKNKTKYDVNAQKAVLTQTIKLVKIIIVVLCSMFVIAGIIVIQNNLIIGIGLIAGGIVAFFLVFFTYEKNLLKAMTKGNKLLQKDNNQYYEFLENEYLVQLESDGEIVGNNVSKYEDLFRIVENKKYLLLYIANNQAYVVDKEGMTEGTIAELTEFLRSKNIKYQTKK